MREIKFRGKRVDKKEWEFGSLFIDEDLNEYSIQGYDYYYDEGGKQREPFWHKVIPETVGQFTGLHDKNGVEIYENDVVYGTIKGLLGQGYQNGIVKYGEYGFVIDLKKQSWEPGIGMVGFCSFEDYEVIGNIHEESENNE